MARTKLTKREKVILGCSAGAVIVVSGIFLVYTKNLRLNTVTIKDGLAPVTIRTGRDLISGSSNVVDNSTTIINAMRQGSPSFIVECVETGKRYLSQADAARAAGVNPRVMSKHILGILDDINGKHYARVGIAIPNNAYDLAA